MRRVDIANVPRARELLGPRIERAVGSIRVLADLQPLVVPTASPGVLLAAAAATYGLCPAELAGPSRRWPAPEARCPFVRLGELESYTHAQLAVALDRTRARVSQLAARPVDEIAVRIARTLVRDPRLKRHLPGIAVAHEAGAG